MMADELVKVLARGIGRVRAEMDDGTALALWPEMFGDGVYVTIHAGWLVDVESMTAAREMTGDPVEFCDLAFWPVDDAPRLASGPGDER